MSVTTTKPDLGRKHLRLGSSGLRWGLSLGFVLGIHASALLLLHRTIPAMGPAALEAIMMDLAPEPTAPEPVPEMPPPPEPPPVPPPPQPSPPPEPLPPEPEAVPPIEDVAPPVPQAEVPLPPPRPPLPRPRPVMVRPITPPAEASPPVPQVMLPGPAAAAPPGQIQATWEGRLLAHLARFKRFPPAAQRRGEQGIVLMRLAIAHSGSVLTMSMAHGSGYPDLDKEAQAWLTRAQPLPAFPAEITAQQMEIVVPLRFTLR